jgi:hypothetical protein
MILSPENLFMAPASTVTPCFPDWIEDYSLALLMMSFPASIAHFIVGHPANSFLIC